MEDPLPAQHDGRNSSNSSSNLDYEHVLTSSDRHQSCRIRTCKRCKFSTTSAKEFLHHQVTEHTDRETHPCDRCDYEAATYLDLVGHKRTEHRRLASLSSAVEQGTRAVMDATSTGVINEANNNEKILAQDKAPSPMLPPGECEVNHAGGQVTASSPEGAEDAIEVFECGVCGFATTKAADLKSHQLKHKVSNDFYKKTSSGPASTSALGSEYEIMQRSYLSPQNGGVRPDDVDDNRLIIDESLPRTVVVVSGQSANVPRPKPVYTTPAAVPHRAKPGPKPGTTGSAVRPRTGCAPVREAVDPAKYITIQEPDGIKYACSKCGNIYKWRKSLNKHWKEKHDGEIPDPRPNLTALNIPRLGKGYVTGLPNGKGSVLSFIGTHQHPAQRATSRPFQGKLPTAHGPALMSGGEVALNSSEIRKVLKRPAMAEVSGSPKAVETPPGGMSKANSMMRYSSAGDLSVIRPSKLVRTSDPGTLPRYVPPAPTSYVKYRSLGDKPELTPPRMQIVRGSTPVNLSRQPARAEDVLDLSNKPSGSLAPASRVSDLDLSGLPPPQDEPLDFSMKSTQEKTEVKPEKTETEDVNSPSQCPSCQYTPDGAHVDCHVGNQQHKCAECQEVFVAMEMLNDHFLHVHADVIQQSLSAVGKDGVHDQTRPAESTQLYKYLTMDSQRRPLTCLVCGTVFQWQWTLAKHFEQQHRLVPNPYKKRPTSTATSSAASTSPPLSGDEAPSDASQQGQIQCSQCVFTAASSSELARHQLKHSVGHQYGCYVCPYVTRWKDQLLAHYKQEHPSSGVDLGQLAPDGGDPDVDCGPYIDLTDNDTAIVFPQAPEDAEYGGSPGREGRRRRGDESPGGGSSSAELLLPFKCTVCEYRARWPSEITQHMKNHSDQKPYLCPRCSYRSKWKWDVVKHLKRCGGGTVNDVIDTTKTTRSHNVQALVSDPTTVSHGLSLGQQRELLSNGPPNVTVLPSGGGTGKKEDGAPPEVADLQTYGDVPTGSPASDDSPTAQKDDGSNVCLHCPFVGNSPAELKRHCRVHSDEKPFICKTCGYCSKWKCDLKKHLRTYKHTSAVPLTYGGHGRKPTDLNDLREGDQDTDSNEGDTQNEDDDSSGSGGGHKVKQPPLYKCDSCQYVTYKKNFMDSHVKIHRPGGGSGGVLNQAAKLKCKQCDFQASDLPAFLQHKLSHSQGADTSQAAVSESNSVDSPPPSTRHRRKASKQQRIQRPSSGDGHAVAPSSERDQQDDGGGSPVDFSQKTLPVVTVNPTVLEPKPTKSTSTVFGCGRCPYTTENRSNFEKHVKFHNSQNKYVCEWCDWSIDSLKLLYRHAQTVHPTDLAHQQNDTFYDGTRPGKPSDDHPAKDDNSDDSDVRGDAEEVPEDDSTAPRMSWCRRQDMSNIERRRLEARWESAGGVGADVDDLPSEFRSKRRRRLKTCSKCGYITDNVTTLQRHMAKHGSKGKFTCSYCDYSVDRQHIVDYHVKIVHQTGMRPADIELGVHDSEDPGEEEEDPGEEEEDPGEEEEDPGEEREELYDSELPHDDDDDVRSREEGDDKNEEVVWEITKVKGHEMKVQRVGRRTTYHCLKCPFYTCNITNAANHIKQHGLRKKYTCELCDYSLDQLRHIMHHMKKVHGHGADLSFSDNNDDGDDVLSDPSPADRPPHGHDEGKPQGAPPARRAGRKSGLRRATARRRRAPKSGRPEVVGMKPTGRHPCRRCQFVALGTAALRRHRAVHRRLGSKIRCQTCRYTATTARLLQKHINNRHHHHN